ncbi:hypothetical protein Z517_06823 [Fonsecaea pedrosoi CBS 271.37]|uniref:Major facilitator superfamily (MFS) profile domain-containing protein n=1 Tax=Fonsecaea pedrosoi CBS 271.37 TaxID=1442368 RepID=A0A0D2GHD3_9EURO|nr:uncharacterized protein Z517_06823 [Fonsecaea pedrosoi CBS 271.37]KIW80208.1 hypothetical protein Z517_06823 [Fonsecaea pedrosoi CBS 271.37]
MLVAGVLLQLIFIPLMCVPSVTQKGMALAFSFFGGMGIGVVDLLPILLIQLASPDKWIGFACAVLGLSRYMGGSTGTAIYLTIYENKVKTLIPKRVAAAALAAGLPSSSLPSFLGVLTGATHQPSLMAIPGVTTAIVETSTLAMKNASREAFKYVWLTSIPFGAIALICALICKDQSNMLTDEVAQRLKTDELEIQVQVETGLEKGASEHFERKNEEVTSTTEAV